MADDLVTTLKQKLIEADRAGDGRAAAAIAAKLIQLQKAEAPQRPSRPLVVSGEGDGGFWSSLGATAKDVGKSLVSGVAKGVTGLPGQPIDLLSLGQLAGQKALAYGSNRPFSEVNAEIAPRSMITPETQQKYGTQAWQKSSGIDFHEPQSRIGSIAEMAGEFAGGGGFVGPGGLKAIPMARNAVRMGLIPGAASETAGQAAEGLSIGGVDLEGPARLATGGATAVLAGKGGGNAARTLSRDLAGVSPAQIEAAQQLIRDSAARGIRLSQDQAIQQVTGNATSIADTAANVAASPGGEALLAHRAQQRGDIATATRREAQGLGAGLAPDQLEQQLTTALTQIREQSPSGQQLTAQIAAAGPPVSPRDTGVAIQPQLTADRQGLEQARRAATDPLRQDAYTTPGGQPRFMPNTGVEGIVRNIDQALTTAKGIPAARVEAARANLFRPDGSLDTSVQGLHGARVALDDLIGEAQRAGHGGAVAQLMDVRRNLDAQLKSIPEMAAHDAAYAQHSAGIRPYTEGAPGKITEIDPLTRQNVLPPQQVGGLIKGQAGAAAEDLATLLPAGTPAHAAMQRHLITEALDKGGRSLDTVRPETLRSWMAANRGTLENFPGVQQRLEQIIASKERFDAQSLTGPLRRMYDSGEPRIKAAIQQLFAFEPGPGGNRDIAQAVQTLNARDPRATRQLVSHYLEDRLNSAIVPTEGGPRNAPGAKLFVDIAGHPEQRHALIDTIAATHGPQVAEGFDRFLEILDATGRTKGLGSPTASRAQYLQQAGESLPRAAGEAGVAIAAGQPVAGAARGLLAINQRLRDWTQTATSRDIARLLTDPAAAAQFRAIAAGNTTGARAQQAIERLGMILPRLAVTGDEANPLRITVRARPE